MQLERIRLIFVKELVEALRDYRTAIPMVFMSLALGPLLTVSWPSLATSQAQKIIEDTYRVALVGTSPQLRDLIMSQRELKLIDIENDPPQQQVDLGRIDAAIVLPP
ncbi:MAG: hypothetical protein JSS86_19015, partial [Cyanobacteria bacterium SZAS LIN-2]|nr:hypothetical protein [Cyanobacteria bacterium SZAS LIN-2]